jgi:hypothetical protein
MLRDADGAYVGVIEDPQFIEEKALLIRTLETLTLSEVAA